MTVRRRFGLTLAAAAIAAASPAAADGGARIFGADKPVTLDDLPSGGFKASLMGLPAATRAAALDRLARLHIPVQDADTLRADRGGALFYREPALPAGAAVRTGLGSGATTATPSIVRNVSTANAFKLHSRPASKNKVYLDFLGGPLTGTAWNNGRKDPYNTLPYDEDGDTTTFSQGELNTIAEVWRRMAEDYAPFDVDLTTEKPASFGPTVAHVLFTPIADADGSPIIDGVAGGIAYVGVWGQSYFTYYQPALVFSDKVPGGKNMAEAGSHELGHNLGLSHDGTSTLGYYGGQGSGNVSWAPIMGVGYYAAISEWSKGEYADANNQEDDIAIIAGHLGVRPDDHAATAAKADPLKVVNGKISAATPITAPFNRSKINRGVIERQGDVDLFYVDVAASGTLQLRVYPSWIDTYLANPPRGENVDLRAVLFRQGATAGTLGARIVQSNPPADTYATVTAQVTPGRYFLRVESVGNGKPAGTGYSRYGSLGQYYIRGFVPTP